jgi:hypothetical protein
MWRGLYYLDPCIHSQVDRLPGTIDRASDVGVSYIRIVSHRHSHTHRLPRPRSQSSRQTDSLFRRNKEGVGWERGITWWSGVGISTRTPSHLYVTVTTRVWICAQLAWIRRTFTTKRGITTVPQLVCVSLQVSSYCERDLMGCGVFERNCMAPS